MLTLRSKASISDISRLLIYLRVLSLMSKLVAEDGMSLVRNIVSDVILGIWFGLRIALVGSGDVPALGPE